MQMSQLGYAGYYQLAVLTYDDVMQCIPEHE